MKFLRVALTAIVLLGVFLVAGALLLPSSAQVERSIVIDRPQAEVFAVLDSFDRFNEWSPWVGHDPDARYDFDGPGSGTGARMSWTGNRMVGSGSQEIRQSEPYARIVVAMDFGGQVSSATYLLEPRGESTALTWRFEARHGYNPLSRWMGLLYERMIGPDYEKGLQQLKTLLETESPRP